MAALAFMLYLCAPLADGNFDCRPAARAPMTGPACMRAARFMYQQYPQYHFECRRVN